jgi:galactofuranose transport system ATP-binding protein
VTADAAYGVSEPELEVRGLTKSFSGVVALRGIDLAVAPGESVALIGENGAGKSTLLNIVSGMFKPDDGEILLRGRQVSFRAPRDSLDAGIATVHQQNRLVPGFSAIQNVQLGREPVRSAIKWLVRRSLPDAVEALQFVGLGDRMHQEVAGLSLADRQLIAVARAVSRGNRVLIFDEPTAAITPDEAEALFALIGRLRERGTALVYVTHRLEELAGITSRVVVLRDGEKIAERPSSIPTREMVGLMAGREAAAHEAEVRQVHVGGGRVDGTGQEAPGLELRSLQDRKDAFRDVNLTVAAGECVGLVGLPDSGVDQLTGALAGARKTLAGEIRVAGKPVSFSSPAAAIRSGIGFLPGDRETKGVIPNFSVRESASISALGTVEVGGMLVGGKEAAVTRRLLDDCQVRAGRFDMPITQLSGGNQQKALLARMLASKPRVIVCQDPTAGVDIAGREALYDLIGESCRGGASVVWQSSDLRELTIVCDRVVVFWRGVVSTELAAAELSVDRLVHAQFNENSIL